jgi:hypothetical protein
MKTSDRAIYNALTARLAEFDEPLSGIASPEARDCFVRQLVDSTHRTKYVELMRARKLSPLRCDPSSPLFDPVLGAIIKLKAGEPEEAAWLVFLSTHFGKSGRTGWELCRRVYGRMGGDPTNTWERTNGNFKEFSQWLERNEERIKNGPPPVSFGNHRKFESLRNLEGRGTHETIRTYIEWVGDYGSHAEMFDQEAAAAKGDRKAAFDRLYKSMNVASFGRLAKFDYLSMVGKVGIAPIVAGSTYVNGATGPLKGAGMLFFGKNKPTMSISELDKRLGRLADALGVTMQDMEDAVCNWQKSPESYKGFRG